MGWLRRRELPLTSPSRGRSGRGCAGAFLVFWGCGFGFGGIAALNGTGNNPGDWFGILFLALGVGAVVLGLRLFLTRRVAPDLATVVTSRAGFGVPAVASVGTPRTLRASGARGCAASFLLFFTLGWWAVVVVMWQRMDHDGGGTLLLYGFAFFGCLLILGSVYSLLALSNPRPEVDLEVVELPIGVEVRLPWRLVGSTARLSKLTVELIGREEATYSLGTDRHTDRHEFHCTVLLAAPIEGATASGTLRFRVPQPAVPSFRAGSNKIVWLIRFRAPIRLWPDVKCELELPVGPGSPDPIGGGS